jgi:enoyl-CoA hydratase/carnithine racemase
MNASPLLECQTADAVATLTIRRPEKLNALTNEIMKALTAALDRIACDDSVRVVVLAGEGRAFSAGFDVSIDSGLPAPTPADWAEHFRLGYTGLRRVWTLPQPVVAKIRGACLGGGFALSLACDLAYASEDAFFGEPEVKFGGSTMAPILALALPPRLYKELVLTGRFLDAQRAQALGLVNEVVVRTPRVDPAGVDNLDARVDQVVRHMCLLPPGTLEKNKALLNRFYDAMGYPSLLDIAQDRSVIGLSTAADNEFTQISRERGVSAALKWQKKRFADVGAF